MTEGNDVCQKNKSYAQNVIGNFLITTTKKLTDKCHEF